MECVNGVNVYKGRLDSISSGSVSGGVLTNYGLVEIGDEAASNVKVFNGLDGKLRSSVGQDVTLWIVKGVLVGLETDGKTYVLDRKIANKGNGAAYTVFTLAGIGVLGALALPIELGVGFGVFGFMMGFASFMLIPKVAMRSRLDNGITEVNKNPGKKVEVSG